MFPGCVKNIIEYISQFLFFLDVDIGNLLITYMVFVIFLLGHFSIGPDGGKCL